MSAAPSAGAAANKGTAEKSADAVKEVKPAAALEEDDEFEDFPVESRFMRSWWEELQLAGEDGVEGEG